MKGLLKENDDAAYWTSLTFKMLLTQDLISSLILLLAAIPKANSFFQSFVECAASHGGTEEEIMNFLQNGEATERVKCIFKCQADFYSVIGADGRLNVPKLITLFPDNAKEIVEKCGNVANAAPASADPCEISYRFHKCFLETDRELYIFVEEA